MFIIVFNQSNIVQDGQNNKLVYKFPNSVNLKDKYIAVSEISIYYSWFNIATIYNNNYFTYTWTAGITTTVYTITIPDGLYEINDLNNLIQFECIKNLTYWTNTAGSVNYYPFEMILNPVRYAVQLNTYLIPTSTPVGAAIPVGFPGWPGTIQNTVVTIPAKLNTIIGFTAGFVSFNNFNNPIGIPTTTAYVQKDQTTGTISYLSTQAPQVQPNNSVIFSLSGINNPYTQPSSVIYSLNPNVGVGEQVFQVPPNFMWCKMIEGTYSELRLTLLGNDLNPLRIQDPNMTFLLTIRDKDESILGSK
jgi:hypothetical protein